jgi:hypothetical protein
LDILIGISTTNTTQSTITNPDPLTQLTRSGDKIVGLYNTRAGQNTGGFNGIYSNANEQPPCAIDSNTLTKYLNFGGTDCSGCTVYQPGIGTGYFVTPSISNATVARALFFATANDSPNRDPITVTLEGSNATTDAQLHQGSSWTLIYNGSTGISSTVSIGRVTYAAQQTFLNLKVFASYRLLVTSQRDNDSAVQYSEAQIFGTA